MSAIGLTDFEARFFYPQAKAQKGREFPDWRKYRENISDVVHQPYSVRLSRNNRLEIPQISLTMKSNSDKSP